MTVLVTLNWSELMIAGTVALQRRAKHCIRGESARYGAPSSGHEIWEYDIFACYAEIAVAKYLNLYWNDVGPEAANCDVGSMVGVRTRMKRTYRLILHKGDQDHVPFVSTWCNPPIIELTGWILAQDGKLERYWSDPTGNRPAYFVPTENLKQMSDLHSWVSDNR